MERVMKYLRVPLWLGLLGLLSYWMWLAVMDVLGSEWFAAPATVLFAFFALLAGPPYWRASSPWRKKIVRVPEEVRRGQRFFGRVVLWRIEGVQSEGKRFGVFRWLALCGALATFAGVGLLAVVKAKFAETLPQSVAAIMAYDPTVASRAYSRDDEHICTFSKTYRVRLPLSAFPQGLVDAVLAAEDDQFYQHQGILPTAMLRAYIENFRAGRTTQGGSTIDQQVVKMLTDRKEPTYKRKLTEALLARELNRRLTKDQILEIYLNNPFMGREAYGMEAAAQIYFGKSVRDLNRAEMAILAGLPQAPSRHSPLGEDPSSMRKRTRYVLDRQVQLGTLTPAERDEALGASLAFIERKSPLNHATAGHFCEQVRKELTQRYGEAALYERGLTVRTTIDMKKQRAAEAAVRWGLRDLERRTIGFTGPVSRDEVSGACGDEPQVPVAEYGEYVGRVTNAGKAPVVCVQGTEFPVHPDDVKRIAAWEAKAKQKLRLGDVLPVAIVTEPPAKKGGKDVRYAISAKRTAGPGINSLQGTFVSIDPRTGEILTMVGGYDFVEDQVNFATMERRQVGSLVKAAVYAVAVEGTDEVPGMNVDETMVDSPRCWPTASGAWCPGNYEGKFKGTVPLRSALAQSLNSVSAQITVKYGPHAVARMLRRLGVTSPLVPVLPISVGAADITPMEMAVVFATIASGGKEIPRHPGSAFGGIYVTEVRDRNGKVLPEYGPPPPREQWKQVLDPADAYALTYLLRGVVEEGTGRGIRQLRRPAAGKTGTNRDVDVWFAMFDTDIVASTWVGYKRPQKIGSKATGGTVALPICLAAVKEIHPDTPPTDFPVPDNVVLLPNAAGDLVPFKRGRVPEKYLPKPSDAAFLANAPF